MAELLPGFACALTGLFVICAGLLIASNAAFADRFMVGVYTAFGGVAIVAFGVVVIFIRWFRP